MHDSSVPLLKSASCEHLGKETARQFWTSFLTLEKDELISKMSYNRHKGGQRSITQTARWYDSDYVAPIKENPGFLNTHTHTQNTHLTYHQSLKRGGECFGSRHEHAIHWSMEISTAKQNCN